MFTQTVDSNLKTMEFSQDEVVECSQKSCRGAKRASGRPRKSYTQRKPKTRTSQRHRTSDSAGGLEIPESSTEESSVNVSGSLFSGQHDLLMQYDEHEKRQLGNPRDDLLERVLEQSRKAYEQLKLQTESRDLFSEDVCPARKEVSVNTEGTEKSEAAVQASQGGGIISKDFGVQVGFAKPDQTDVAVQLSPNVSKRQTKDAEIQLSPQKEAKKMKTDAGVNTDTVLREDATAQTMKVEKRNVGVQKYHSTRVREMAVQTSVGELNRNVGKRNVCVQQRSSGMLELNREVALVLGIELKCDPTRLQRLLMRVAAKQCSRDADESSDQPSTVGAEFTEEDPYWANYEYFMNDVVTDDGGTSDSGLGEIEPRMSCCIEESIG
ncbi:uncharacterized protein LOC135708610 [Ochlerotatus camptorhynchus]|uniref:uncharacterized protein LOC135708610 n=1 Tax=Ochlerotatus camptorhynchus TaxID=644619 RepID=UPI0031D29882